MKLYTIKRKKLSSRFWEINILSGRKTTTTTESALEKLRCISAGGAKRLFITLQTLLAKRIWMPGLKKIKIRGVANLNFPISLGRRCPSINRWRVRNILFVVMMYSWRHDELFDVMTCFWRHDIFLTSWRTAWCYDELCNVMRNFLTSWRVFDVMTNVLTSWRALRRHDVLWRHDKY